MVKKLENLKGFAGVEGPVLTIVMDGVGLAPAGEGNAVERAVTPTLDMLMKNYPTVSLKAHGTAVGLPSDDDMGTLSSRPGRLFSSSFRSSHFSGSSIM